MGSSNYASISASLYLNKNGIESNVISAGQLLYYGLNSLDENTLIVMVSQSGESPEIINLLNKFKGRGNIVGITNILNSTLGKSGIECLHLLK